MRRCSGGIPAHHLKYRKVEMSIDSGADVADFGRARHHLLGDFARPIDFAKRPENQGQVGRDGNSEVLGKTKGELAIALRIKDPERAFKRNARICKISRIPVRGAVDASGDAGLGRPLPSLDFAVDNFGDVPHRRQLSAHEIPDPEAVVDRETLGRVLNAGG